MNFEPHDYQNYAIDYIETHPVSAVLLDMGLGKTVISLTAIANLLFDSFLAQALELGPLRKEEPILPPALVEQLRSLTPKGVPVEMVETLAAYYFANKPEDSDWVVLPVANFDAYFGTTSFGRKYLKQIPETFLERSETGFGLCRYRLGNVLAIKQG